MSVRSLSITKWGNTMGIEPMAHWLNYEWKELGGSLFRSMGNITAYRQREQNINLEINTLTVIQKELTSHNWKIMCYHVFSPNITCDHCNLGLLPVEGAITGTSLVSWLAPPLQRTPTSSPWEQSVRPQIPRRQSSREASEPSQLTSSNRMRPVPSPNAPSSTTSAWPLRGRRGRRRRRRKKRMSQTYTMH